MSLRKLASETAVYGLSSIVGRGLYFFLTPLYTSVFAEVEYGIQTTVFAVVSFVLVVAGLRLDVAYFRFHGKESEAALTGTATLVTAAVAGTIGGGLSLLSPWLTRTLGYPEYEWVFALAGGIVFFDALTELPLAKLRTQGRAWRFAGVRLAGTFVNIGLNLLWLYVLPQLADAPEWLSGSPGGVTAIFVANIVSSGVVVALLLPELRGMRFGVDGALLRRLLGFSLPLVVVGLSYIVNEVFDRYMLPVLWPGGKAEGLALAGVYAANYKLAMLLALFTQAFRYGVEPFVFRESGASDAKVKYARLGHYYLIAALVGVLGVSLFLPVFSQTFLKAPGYRAGGGVVPVLLCANLLLGLYYNFSVWYKVTDNTRVGAYVSLGGAAVTVVLNLLLIPTYGFYGCAWTTFVCYAAMAATTLYLGQRRYPIPYPTSRMLSYSGLAAVALALSWGLSPKLAKPILALCVEGGTYREWATAMGLSAVLLIGFIVAIGATERRAVWTPAPSA